MSAVNGMRRLAHDDGLSAAELLIASVVTILVLVMASSFFLSGTTSIMRSRNTALDAGTASNALTELSKVIRSGTPNPVLNNSLPDPIFLAGTAESVTLYSYADAAVTNTRPAIVQFSVDATTRQLVEKRWAVTAAAGGYFTFPDYTTATPTFTRTIAGPISVTPSGKSPLFSYLSAAGTIAIAGSGLTVTQCGAVTSVLATVRVNGSGYAGATGVEVQSTIGLPNLGLGN